MNKKNDVEIIKHKTSHSGFFDVVVTELRFRLFEGGWSPAVTRDYVKRRKAVAVLLYDPILDKVVLLEQFRVGAIDDEHSPWLFEIVAGLVETGEAYEDVAVRESLEESDCVIKKIIPISNYYVSPGSSNECTHSFCGLIDAQDAGGIHGLDHEAEDIKLHVFKSAVAFEMVKTNKIRNADAIIALQWLELNRHSLKDML
ncbi:MAG: NUDIX domain-containing protein [Gammaproteobacteria bacterium]|nr:NUDIX domain-containing protein [Gammaproteobacteria bacterium]MCH9743420.1 NUDIX domain-containing protein [Gammaproteobacteria bacterium]